MLERNSGFDTLLKFNAPHITVTHCLVHRHALATKTFTPKLTEVLKIVVEYANYVRNNAMKQRIFKDLCNEINSVFEMLLYYSNVWWLSYDMKNAEPCFYLACGISHVIARAPTSSCRLF